MPSVYMYHIFIHSSVSGLLDCFQVVSMAPEITAAMNIVVHVSFQIKIFSQYTPRSGIAGLCGSSILVFWGTSIVFSIAAAPIYIPTVCTGEFLLLHTLSSIYYL